MVSYFTTTGCHILLPFLIFAQFSIRQSKRLNVGSTYVFAKFKRFEQKCDMLYKNGIFYNGVIFCKMVPYFPRWCHIIQNSVIFSNMMAYLPKLCHIIEYGAKLFEIKSYFLIWYDIFKNCVIFKKYCIIFLRWCHISKLKSYFQQK